MKQEIKVDTIAECLRSLCSLIYDGTGHSRTVEFVCLRLLPVSYTHLTLV